MDQAKESRRIVSMTVINDLTGDQRAHRIADTLQEAGYHVLLIGRKLPDSLPLEKRTYRTKRIKLLFRKGKIFYLAYNFRLFLFLLFQKVHILNANDLDTLLANYLVSRLRGIPLVYDSHEYFTEVPELVDRQLSRSIWLSLERWIFPKLKHVYSVSGAIAQRYEEMYHVPVNIIRNLPFFQNQSLAQKNLVPTLIYQGALNKGRGLELMIEAMALLPSYQLWIIGKGDVENKLKSLVGHLDLRKRVIFKGFVPLGELPELTQKAWLGLSLEEDLGANYRFALPNKLFDYIQGHVPVLVSDLPEMKNIVETYQVGMFLPSTNRTAEALAQHIQTYLQDEKKWQEHMKNCKKASVELCWEREKEKLLEIYGGIFE